MRFLLSIVILSVLSTAYSSEMNFRMYHETAIANGDSIDLNCPIEMLNQFNIPMNNNSIVKEANVNLKGCSLKLADDGIQFVVTGTFYVYAVKEVLMTTQTGKIRGSFSSTVHLDPYCNMTSVDFSTSQKSFDSPLGWIAKQWFYIFNGEEQLENKFKGALAEQVEKLKANNKDVRDLCAL